MAFPATPLNPVVLERRPPSARFIAGDGERTSSKMEQGSVKGRAEAGPTRRTSLPFDLILNRFCLMSARQKSAPGGVV